MDFENETIIPEYLLNDLEQTESTDEVNEQTESTDEVNEQTESTDQVNEQTESIDLSSIESQLNDILTNQETIISQNVDYTEHLNGLLQNTYFITYFLFAFFVFGALVLVIKFFKGFF